MYIYKDKVKVFGDHDENTLEQMLNCYNAGAVDAVLCSDGHLGYAQSIGGVTAYQGLDTIRLVVTWLSRQISNTLM